MAEEKRCATVCWSPEDVLELRPDWTVEQAEWNCIALKEGGYNRKNR